MGDSSQYIKLIEIVRRMYAIDRIRFPRLINSSSESSDEEDTVPVPRRKMIKEHYDLFHLLDKIEFKKRFRMDKHSVNSLFDLLGDDLECINDRNKPVSKMNQLLICLRFYASGSFQINIGDLFNISQPTDSRIISRITRKIGQLRPHIIKMPLNCEERMNTVREFYKIAHFPGVIGTIDGMHVKIYSPGGPTAEIFRNRKGCFSINVQVVSDANLNIKVIFARWPGSLHDTTILNDSLIRAKLKANEYPDFYILGDSDYPCRAYLLTPILEPRNLAEQRYNRAHIHTRNTVERLFGVWKRRFPCLSLGMRVGAEKACEIIVATAVLHNMCNAMNDAEPVAEFALENFNQEIQQPVLNGAQHNTAIINTVFAN